MCWVRIDLFQISLSQRSWSRGLSPRGSCSTSTTSCCPRNSRLTADSTRRKQQSPPYTTTSCAPPTLIVTPHSFYSVWAERLTPSTTRSCWRCYSTGSASTARLWTGSGHTWPTVIVNGSCSATSPVDCSVVSVPHDNEWWQCIGLKCVWKPTKSRLSLTHRANKSSRWAE